MKKINLKIAVKNYDYCVLLHLLIFALISIICKWLGAFDMIASWVMAINSVEILEKNSAKKYQYYIDECKKVDELHELGIMNDQIYEERREKLIAKFNKNFK